MPHLLYYWMASDRSGSKIDLTAANHHFSLTNSIRYTVTSMRLSPKASIPRKLSRYIVGFKQISADLQISGRILLGKARQSEPQFYEFWVAVVVLNKSLY